MEKLATPDVTIADMIGDIDPIKAARRGQDISDELTIHYGLLPRANRGIFAINELPDLAGKIQVGLFNIMQEGDVQIKGYPVRLPLDLAAGLHRQPGRLHRARQDHHAAQGPHRQRNPHALSGRAGTGHGHHRAGGLDPTGRRPSNCACPITSARSSSSSPFWRAKTSASTSAPASPSACPSPCWKTSSPTPSGARCETGEESGRAAHARPLCRAALHDRQAGAGIRRRIEGRRRRGRELIRVAVGKMYNHYFEGANMAQIVQWFDLGGSLKLDDGVDSAAMVRQLGGIQGLMEKTKALGLTLNEPDAVRASAAEFVLEGLHAHRRISRNEERGYAAEERNAKPREPREPDETPASAGAASLINRGSHCRGLSSPNDNGR